MIAGPVLAVCGSGIGGAPAFSVALQRPGAATVTAASPPGNRGDLARLTHLVLAEARLTARELRAIVVDRGPGSYIGLRVAATFARTLAAFAAIELFAVDSLAAAACAAAAESQGPSRRCLVLDGRQQRLQVAIHGFDRGAPTAIAPARLLPDAELADLLQAGDLVHVDVAALPRVAAAIANAGAVALALPPLVAATLLRTEVPRTAVAPTELEPVYLAGSYVG